jgi:hypothetical protein
VKATQFTFPSDLEIVMELQPVRWWHKDDFYQQRLAQ